MGASSLKPVWLISDRLPAWQKRLVDQLRARCPKDPDLTWILSSGTQSINQVKAIGMSSKAIEASARAVNRFLNVSPADRWVLALPTYHIGGYAILVRARLSRSKVFELKKWSPHKFVALVDQNKITLASMVPTQVHDVVVANLKCPDSLRAIVVGGGALTPDLYRRARALGWPVLPSYGLTECASQVATASLASLRVSEYPALQILPHAQIEIRDGRVWIQARSVARFVATLNREGQFTLEHPLRNGWLPTEDLGAWSEAGFQPLGRRDEVIKVLGVLVSLPQVEADLAAWTRELKGRAIVLDGLSARAGRELVVVTDSPDSLATWELAIKRYNESALGPVRIHRFYWVHELPCTSLGKVKRQELKALLKLQVIGVEAANAKFL